MRQTRSATDYLHLSQRVTESMVDTLTDVVTVQRNMGTPDAGGSIVSDWQNVVGLTDIPCYVSKHKANHESATGDRVISEDEFVFHLEPSASVVPSDRLLWHSVVYEISSVFAPNTANPFVTIFATLFR